MTPDERASAQRDRVAQLMRQRHVEDPLERSICRDQIRRVLISLHLLQAHERMERIKRTLEADNG